MTTPLPKIATACGFLMLVTAATASSAENLFECHVITEGDQVGLTYIQTEGNQASAVKMVQTSAARIADGSVAPVTKVIRCIKTSAPIPERSDEQLREYLSTIKQ